MRLEWICVAFLGALACAAPPEAPVNPLWSDVAPIVRGQCASCHGWTARETGGGYRLDLFDAPASVCGDAAPALDVSLLLAGSPLAASQIKDDIVRQGDARWPRMPPQPAPALPDWQRDTLLRWSAQPVKGPPPATNRAPVVSVSQFPAVADKLLTFAAVLDDADNDAILGTISVAGLSFVMNHAGAFSVSFNTAAWPAGPQPVIATLCDGWEAVSYDLGSVRIQH